MHDATRHLSRRLRAGARRHVALAAAAALALGASASASAEHHESGEHPEASDGAHHREAASDAAAKPDDAGIAEEVQAELRRDPLVELHDVKVASEDGVVTLRGNVRARHERERAELVARGVEGVGRVENEIVVGKGLGDPDAIPPLEPGSGGLPGASGALP
jgi:hyperosmotically inducible protein